MLTKTPVINQDTRNSLKKRLEDHFQYEEGTDLDSAVKEILNDKDVFLFLATYFNKNQGLYLGAMSYFDDATVNVHFGLILDWKPYKLKTQKLKIFSFHDSARSLVYGRKRHHVSKDDMAHFYLSDEIPSHVMLGDSKVLLNNYPPVEWFASRVNEVLQKPEENYIEFVE